MNIMIPQTFIGKIQGFVLNFPEYYVTVEFFFTLLKDCHKGKNQSTVPFSPVNNIEKRCLNLLLRLQLLNLKEST